MKQFMTAEQFVSILDYLELDIPAAAIAFGLPEDEVLAMVTGKASVPFLVSAMTVLMCEGETATSLALQHGRAWLHDEPKLADVISEATGVFVPAHKQPRLRLVKDEE